MNVRTDGRPGRGVSREPLCAAFEPWAVIPAQLAAGKTTRPEERLVAAMLEEAIRAVASDSHRQIARDAWEWIDDIADRDVPWSWAWCCGVMGFDGRRARDALASRYAARIRWITHRGRPRDVSAAEVVWREIERERPAPYRIARLASLGILSQFQIRDSLTALVRRGLIHRVGTGCYAATRRGQESAA